MDEGSKNFLFYKERGGRNTLALIYLKLMMTSDSIEPE